MSERGTIESPAVLVLGVGGSGRTHRLRELADETAVWLTGSPLRPLNRPAVEAALATAAGNQTPTLVIDDAQWADEEALDVLATAVPSMRMIASMRPWPVSDQTRAFADVMGAQGTVERLDRMDDAGVAGVVSGVSGRASSTDLITAMLDVTGGSAGLVGDAVATGFDGDLTQLPDQTTAAVMARIERSGPDAVAALELASLDRSSRDDRQDMGVYTSVLDDPDQAEAAVRASGALMPDGRCAPIVRAAIRHALPSQRRRQRHDQLAILLADIDAGAAAEHLLSGTRSLPDHNERLVRAANAVAVVDADRCLELLERAAEFGPLDVELTIAEATAAFWAGRHDVLGRISPPTDAKRSHRVRLAQLGFGIDVRDLRWASAAEREVDPALTSFAAICVGEQREPVETDGASTATRLLSGLEAVIEGKSGDGLERLVMVVDDADRTTWTEPLGITPHAVGSLAAMWIGDLPAAASLLERAEALRSGGEGEARTHALLAAYAGLLAGRSSDALAVVEAGDEQRWPQRDRLLVAAIDAAIARRSGDTQRLRDAWARAESALLRPASSWLFFDPVVELLTAGARLGDERRVAPVAVALTQQLAAMPAAGAGPTAGHWLSLQLALARRDDAAVQAAAAAMADHSTEDPRSLARVVAGATWAALGRGETDEAAAMAAMDALVPVGDGWEASRLLGQTALDHPDPQAARRLLEAARSLANDPADENGNDGLVALGLSEREAEVAVLVTEGNTHREVGATLFISPKTVEHHVAKIRQKLGVSSRAEMMAIVRQATSGGGD